MQTSSWCASPSADPQDTIARCRRLPRETRPHHSTKGPARRPALAPWYSSRSAHHDDPGADPHAIVEVDHVVIEQSKAARRHRLADRFRLVRAVNAIKRGAEIHRAR